MAISLYEIIQGIIIITLITGSAIYVGSIIFPTTWRKCYVFFYARLGLKETTARHTPLPSSRACTSCHTCAGCYTHKTSVTTEYSAKK